MVLPTSDCYPSSRLPTSTPLVPSTMRPHNRTSNTDGQEQAPNEDDADQLDPMSLEAKNSTLIRVRLGCNDWRLYMDPLKVTRWQGYIIHSIFGLTSIRISVRCRRRTRNIATGTCEGITFKRLLRTNWSCKKLEKAGRELTSCRHITPVGCGWHCPRDITASTSKRIDISLTLQPLQLWNLSTKNVRKLNRG